MPKLIIANWKTNPATVVEAMRLARAEDRAGVVIAPPSAFLAAVEATTKRAALGAQDVSREKRGAHTGEVAPSMLRSLGVRYVIVGHSERRARGETDEEVNEKVKAVLAARLVPVLCVGESWVVRKKGFPAAKKFVSGQLRADLKGVRAKNVIVAYEPVWAIGSGKADSPEEAAEMARFVKKSFVPRVLYGGSVTPKNASAFLKERAIDGALVGGASLKPSDFKKILSHVPTR